jgi:hypothetical protein
MIYPDFKYTVQLKAVPKEEFDSKMFADSELHERMSWCFDHIGRLSMLDPNSGDWCSGLEYQNNNQDIARVFGFKRSEDAVLFALRWT